MTRKGYIYRGLLGWSVAWWLGNGETRYVHGLPTWTSARATMLREWANPPLSQNGFCTQVIDARFGMEER